MTDVQIISELIGITISSVLLIGILKSLFFGRTDTATKNIYVVVKSEKMGCSFPVWEYVTHYSDEASAKAHARSLQESNDSIDARRDYIRFKTVALAIQDNPFNNGTMLLKKEYNRRCELVRANLATSYIL